jgi:quercetin dioxygenase-like cupin family protein
LYRDLGFAKATQGLVQAHVLRFSESYDPAVAGRRHYHDCSFQLDYLLKGWIKFEFEGVGEVEMRPGSSWIQPGGVPHTVLGYSDDCELLEIIVPAVFDTTDVAPVKRPG